MFGFLVKITFDKDSIFCQSGVKTTTIHNCTEVHYGYEKVYNGKVQKVAFESSIHDTGVTYHVQDIEQFEVFPETELSETF